MALGEERLKALYGILRKRRAPHRYGSWRWGVGLVVTAAIALMIFTDTLRFDFWRGQHKWRGEVLSLAEVGKLFAFPFLAINVAIILATRFFGRYLCGFVCPVGSLARLTESARRGRHTGAFAKALPAVVCTVMGALTFAFWVDPRVFLEGSTLAKVMAALFLTLLVGGLLALSYGAGLRFCRDLCPSGVYFALLGHETRFGIEFAHPESCTDCGLCETACPMDLVPRGMSGGAHREPRGFYPEGLSNFSNCIRCGDCVIACEAGSQGATDLPLRLGALPAHAREARETELATSGQEAEVTK